MLFLNIYYYKEGKREEIIERRLANGTGITEGTKLVGEWSRLDGSGGYMLYEQDKPD